MKKLIKDLRNRIGVWIIYIVSIVGISYVVTWGVIDLLFPEPPTSRPFFDMLKKREIIYDDLLKLSNDAPTITPAAIPLFDVSIGDVTVADLQIQNPKKADALEQSGGSEVTLPAYKIAFIIMNKGTKVAMIGGKMVKEGDKIGLETIKKIESTRVLLEYKTPRWIAF